MLRLCFAVCGLVLFSASSIWAHGTQIQITNTGNKIVTRNAMTDYYGSPTIIPPAPPTITDPIRVYQMPLLLDVSGQTFTYPTTTQPLANSGPGFAFGTGGFFDTGTISLNLLDGLKVWNGSSFIDPGLEQINVFRGSVTATTPAIQMTTADAGPISSIVVSAAAAMPLGTELLGDSFHTGVRYRMLGDGSSRTSIGDDGVYLPAVFAEFDASGIDGIGAVFLFARQELGRWRIERRVELFVDEQWIFASAIASDSRTGNVGFVCCVCSPRPLELPAQQSR